MITVVKVQDREEGQVKAHEILKPLVDRQTLLVLSGGTSPNYRRMIVDPEDILPVAVCVADERWGESFHKDSNELFLRNAGIIDFCRKNGIGYHGVLKGGALVKGRTLKEIASEYDRVITKLFSGFSKKVGVMGIGSNLHTAGIFSNSVALHSPDYVVGEEVDDQFRKRITLTLKALGEFSNFVILVFGEEKRSALVKMLDEGQNDMQKYPAIFYRKVKILSFLITDISRP